MSNAPGPAAPVSPSQVAQGVCALSGRIHSQSSYRSQTGRVFVTVVKLPAPDAYSTPQTVELRSAERLGDVGEDWTGRVRVGGYGRTYTKTGPDGESVRVLTADNHLTVI